MIRLEPLELDLQSNYPTKIFKTLRTRLPISRQSTGPTRPSNTGADRTKMQRNPEKKPQNNAD